MGAIALGLAGCVDLANASRWSMFRGEGNNHASTRESPNGASTLSWELPLEDLPEVEGGTVLPSSPVADDETAYIAVRMHTEGDETDVLGLLAIDLFTGSLRWSRFVDHDHPDPASIVPPPVIADELVTVIGATQAYVFDREEGHSRFDFTLPWVPETVPGADRFLIAMGGRGIAMADLEEDQAIRWDYSTVDHEVQPINPPTVIDDRLYVPLGDELIAMRRGDGIRLWQERVPLDDGVLTAPPLVDGYHLHLRVRTEDGTDELVALSRGDRSIRWQEPLGPASTHPIGMPAYSGGRLLATTDDELIAVFVGNGDRDWTLPIDIDAPYPTVGRDNVFLLGEQELVTVDRREGEERNRVALPGTPPTTPTEPVPRDAVTVVTRGDRILAIGGR